jgi:hypothetical protein
MEISARNFEIHRAKSSLGFETTIPYLISKGVIPALMTTKSPCFAISNSGAAE